jgi:L-amino acid N-acyltransferase YncA
MEQHMGSMQIRDAIAADLPAIVEIYNATIASQIVTADLEPISVASRWDWFQSHPCDRHPLWVMTDGEEVLGWLGFQPFYGRPAYAHTAELSIYIAPSQQRRGIGRTLLTRAIAHSPALNIRTLLGFIFADNHPSLRLFEQFEFVQWGCLPRVANFEGVERDLVIVGRRL